MEEVNKNTELNDSDKYLTDDDFLVELDKVMEDDTNYYGHL